MKILLVICLCLVAGCGAIERPKYESPKWRSEWPYEQQRKVQQRIKQGLDVKANEFIVIGEK